MFHKRLKAALGLGLGAAAFLVVFSRTVRACEGPQLLKEATSDEVRRYLRQQHKAVLTLLGYSDAEYEDKAALLRHVTTILTGVDPKSTIINIGATSTGIGAVYELAKTMGFTTSGIISTLARESGAKISPCADLVFFVKDTSWGGFVKHTNRLSPTSATIVDVSDSLIAIGGGDVARDEFRGAERAGKTVTFIPADMNHAIARERARRQGRPAPTDFRGALGTAVGSGPRT